MIAFDLAVRRGSFDLCAEATLETAVTGVFGPSGAGKSTLLHVLAGLVTPDRGRIAVDGCVWFDSERGLDVPTHHRRVGMVFQDARLFPHYSVRGNLRFGCARRGEKGDVGFDDVVSLLELGPLLQRPVRTLSGGEGQRVALGRALLSSPRLLLLDEPMAALDRGLKQQILPFLLKVRDAVEIPIVYVSHDLGEILQLTDHILLLERGSVKGVGRYLDLVLTPDVWSGDPQLVNVLPAHVESLDEASGFTTLALVSPKGEATRARLHAGYRADLSPGRRVCVSMRPEDVALSLEPIQGISIQNQLPGTVRRISRRVGQAMLEVDVGVPMLSHVTAKTMDTMDLREGTPVVCLIKSNALRLEAPVVGMG